MNISKCLKQVYLIAQAWNTESAFAFSKVLKAFAMIERNGWGDTHLTVRGEILGSVKGELMRKRFSKTFLLIKNEG